MTWIDAAMPPNHVLLPKAEDLSAALLLLLLLTTRVEEYAIDHDVDASVLNRLSRVGDLNGGR